MATLRRSRSPRSGAGRRACTVAALAAVAAAAAAVALAGCATSPGLSASDGRLQAIASTGLLRDLVQNVGGDRVVAASLVPDNADPHAFEPTLRDVRDVVYADVAFTNYMLLEQHSVIKTLDANLRDGVPSVSLAEESVKYAAELIPLVENLNLDTIWLYRAAHRRSCRRHGPLDADRRRGARLVRALHDRRVRHRRPGDRRAARRRWRRLRAGAGRRGRRRRRARPRRLERWLRIRQRPGRRGGGSGVGGSRRGGSGSGGGNRGGSGSGGGKTVRRARLRLVTSGTARLRGRTLSVRQRVGARSRVRVTVRRGGRLVARAPAPARPIGPRARVVRVRLDRRLAPGAYRVRLRARAGQRSATKTVPLRVTRR